MFTWKTKIVKAVINTLDHFIISAHSLYGWQIETVWEALTGNGLKVCIRKSVFVFFFLFFKKKKKKRKIPVCEETDKQRSLGSDGIFFFFFFIKIPLSLFCESHSGKFPWEDKLWNSNAPFRLCHCERRQGRGVLASSLLRWCQNNWKNLMTEIQFLISFKLAFTPTFCSSCFLKSRVCV